MKRATLADNLFRKKLFNANYLVFIIMTIMFINLLSSVVMETDTVDEKTHLVYGIKILHLDPARIPGDDSKMPLSVLNAMPYIAMSAITSRIPFFYSEAMLKEQVNLTAGRVPTILFAVAIGFFVYAWSARLYGTKAGVFSLFLYSMCPTIIAHSRLITTDAYNMGFHFLAFYTFWIFLNRPRYDTCAVSALIFGLAQISKYTNIYLFAVFPFLLAIYLFSNRTKIVVSAHAIRTFFSYFILYITFVLITINLSYFFHNTGKPAEFYLPEIAISEVQKDSRIYDLIKEIPLPFPTPYLEGLARVIMKERGFTDEMNYVYVFGEKILKGRGNFKHYYAIYLLFKEPIAILVFIITAVILYIRKKPTFILGNELYLLLPVLILFAYFSFIFQRQMGRFILPIFPLLFVFCGTIFENWEEKAKLFKMIICFFCIYLVASVFSYFPHYLAYFNELAGDRKESYKIMVGTQLNWGQSRWHVKRYLEKHPDVILNPEKRVKGRILVDTTLLSGVGKNDTYKWLREGYKPIGHVAFTHLLFDIEE